MPGIAAGSRRPRSAPTTGAHPVLREAVELGDALVVHLVLNRPHARNAITLELAEALHTALGEAAGEASVIVIRGAGGHFCAGGDVDEVLRLRAEGPEALRSLFTTFVGTCERIAEIDVPVVAAVEGYALAGGFELLQSCDIVVVREDAVLGDHHLNVGMVPGGGGSQRLPRIVGLPRALGHILTGDRLSGAEAVAWGLAYRCAPAARFDDAVAEVVASLVAKHPAALARAKRLVRDGMKGPLADGLALETEAVVDHLQHARLARRGQRPPQEAG